jgi:hypothetical protein
MTRAWNALMRQASLQYFLAGLVVVNSRSHGSKAQRLEISSRWLDLRVPRWKSSRQSPPCSAQTLEGLYAESLVPQPSTMQMRPIPYVFVFNISSAKLSPAGGRVARRGASTQGPAAFTASTRVA